MAESFANQKGLSLERLRTLRDVARAGGIRAAVGDDPVRQSLASRQLKELSECVGVRLTQRVGQRLGLTTAGKALADIAQGFFAELERFVVRQQGQPLQVSLGIGDSVFQWYLLPRLPELQVVCPEVSVIPHSMETAEIVRRVASGQLDLGVVRASAVDGHDIRKRALGTIEFRVFAPRQLLHSAKRGAAIEQALWLLPFGTLTGSGEYVRAVNALLSEHGVSPALRCSSLSQVFGAVQSGQYAAVLPEGARSGFVAEHAVEYNLAGLAAVSRAMVLIWRPSLLRSDAAYCSLTEKLAETLSEQIGRGRSLHHTASLVGTE